MIQELTHIAEELKAQRPVSPVTVRTFLSWFDAQRRGYFVVARIKQQLEEAGVSTFPDFESAWIDTPIGFILTSSKQALVEEDPGIDSSISTARPTDDVLVSGTETTNRISKDPTYRVSKLQAANQIIVSIKPDSTITQAVTLMLAGGFSQLPVMTNERDVKGTITWKSIGSRMALGASAELARDFMERHYEISSDTSIFSAIPLIVANDYVLVRGIDNRITGIITANDLSVQFRNLTEPFLLLSEIENLVRNRIGKRFSPTDLASAREPDSTDRQIQNVADMTIGEYIRLLQNPERWAQLALRVDRNIFCKQLDEVRQIRNDVMHFDPDGITEDALEHLRDFANFLKQLENISSRS